VTNTLVEPVAVTTRVTPVVAVPQRLRQWDGDNGSTGAISSHRVDAEEPTFAGHYPSFPIFPGVCVLDCILASACATPPAGVGRLVLREVVSVRFLGAVFPDEDFEVEHQWTARGEAWRCVATARGARGDVATVRAMFLEARP
jgi:3-hydroxyacyl-[acyl-carrier-protein] dehydratase